MRTGGATAAQGQKEEEAEGVVRANNSFSGCDQRQRQAADHQAVDHQAVDHHAVDHQAVDHQAAARDVMWDLAPP